jgi:hypothetical protein
MLRKRALTNTLPVTKFQSHRPSSVLSSASRSRSSLSASFCSISRRWVMSRSMAMKWVSSPCSSTRGCTSTWTQ